MQNTIHSRDIVFGLKPNRCLFFQLGDSFVCARKQENGKWQVVESRKKLADLIAILEKEWKKIDVPALPRPVNSAKNESYAKNRVPVACEDTKKEDDMMFTLAKWCIIYVLIASLVSLWLPRFA